MLSQQIWIGFDTINPPGQEAACTEYLRHLLARAGFHCEAAPLAEGRPNLIANVGGTGDRPPIAFTGHTDTVPLGAKTWSVPPHGGLVQDGRLWGRRAADMKSGIGAFVVAALPRAERLKGTPGVVLYITGGERADVRPQGCAVAAGDDARRHRRWRCSDAHPWSWPGTHGAPDRMVCLCAHRGGGSHLLPVN